MVKVTPEQFDLFMAESIGGVWYKSEDGSEVTYTTSDGVNNITIKYNNETGIMTYMNDFSAAQGKAVGSEYYRKPPHGKVRWLFFAFYSKI